MYSEKTVRNGAYVDLDNCGLIGTIHGEDKEVNWLVIREYWYYDYEGGASILRPTSKLSLPEEYLL